MKIDELIALLILVTYFGMLAVEQRRRARAFPPVPHWHELGLGFLALLFMLNGLVPALLPMQWIAAHALLPGWKLGVAGGAVLGYLGATLLDYAVHQLHHSPRRVDIYGSAYANSIEICLMVAQGVFMLVFGLGLGLDPTAGAIAGYASAFCAMFQHWNIRTPRWLGNFIQLRNRSWTRPSGPGCGALARRDDAAGSCPRGAPTPPARRSAAESGV